MTNSVLRNIFRFIILIIIQIFIFNRIYLGGYLNPEVYLMFVVLLPFETPWWLLLLSSFSIGLSVDVFSGSLGIHAAATTFAAFSRPFIIRFMLPKLEKGNNAYPSINFMGIPTFSVYVTILVFLHGFLLFFLEVFRLGEIGSVLLRILLSTIISSALIILLSAIFKSQKR